MKDHDSFVEIAHYLRTELFPNSNPLSQRVLLNLYRLVAKGSPVSLDTLAATLGLGGKAVKEVIAAVAPSRVQYDEAGRITAFAGLSQAPARHRFTLGARELFTWCAFDALFLPEILGASAQVISTCPIAETEVRVTVTLQGLEAVTPGDAVMSFVMPSAESCSTNLRGVFCNHVNFLSSQKAGAAWAERNPDAAILSLEDAFALGRIRNQSAFGGVLAESNETMTTRGAT